jgi:hypothetical protein
MRHFSSAICRVFLLSLILNPIGWALAQGLSAPTLQAFPAEGHTVTLQWTDSEGYRTNRIYRKSGSFDWTEIAETGQASSYWDRTTVAGVTYTYRVQAVTQDGRFTYSNEAFATTAGPTLQPPSTAPTFNADVAFNNVRLRWLPLEGVTGYQIEELYIGVPWHELVTVDANTSEHIITGLKPGSTYMFRIRGFNHVGFSPYSYVTVTAPYDPNIIPPAPTMYYASPFSDTSTTIQWSFVPQAWGYIVEYKTGASGWIQVTNVSGDVTFTRHENLSPSTEYTYRVRAYNGAGESAYSAEATTSTYPPPPSSPQLRGLPVSYKEIELRWTDVLTNCCTTPGYIGYRLEAWNGNAWSDLYFAGVDDTNYFISGLQPSTEYTYRIVALHPLASVWSTNTVRTMDPPPIPPPTAPVFYADPYSPSAVQLKWLDVYLETEYRIERENFPGAGAWQQIAIVPANTTSYRDIDLQPGTTYVYRIRAANSYGTSDYSLEAAATTPLPPEFPVVQAGPISSTAVSLWVRPAEGAVSYQLQRLNRSGEWDVLYETNTAPFRFEDTGLTPSTPYTYRVAARQDDRAPVWAYSAQVTTQTWPLEFSATGRALSPTSIELSWPPLPYAEHIYIRQLTNGVWAFQSIELDGTATNYVVARLAPNTTYTYRVYGGYSMGIRSPEAEVTITTPGSISGDIVITSIAPADAGAAFRLRLTGSTGQKFKVQSTSDFQSWTDRTDPLTLTADMEVSVPSIGNAAFYRTIKLD